MAIGADPTRASTPRAARAGFTLIEMMVVLVIVGLLASAVILTLPNGQLSLAGESERFAARLLRAREESLLVNRQVRVSVSSSEYRFDIRDGRDWRALDKAPFSPMAWEPDTHVASGEGEAAVVFEPTGQASGAEFTLGRGGANDYVVSVDIAGNVAVNATRSL